MRQTILPPTWIPLRHPLAWGLGFFSLLGLGTWPLIRADEVRRPNLLMVVSDDQSWPHCGIYGTPHLKTPSFDRIAREGVLFTHAFCPASQCSPSRAALLTGQNIWQLREAGTQASLFPNDIPTYPDLLEAAGYQVGYTGKPWGPGSWKAGHRTRNPAGHEFNSRHLTPPTSEISKIDYAANFSEFLQDKPNEKPFCFWFGCYEPHRNFERGSALRSGKTPDQIKVPPFYPDQLNVREDLLDYFLEIEWFDQQLGKMIAILEQAGELEHTLILVTSDNGMPFPRAKATLYESGTRVPLAIRWPQRIKGGRVLGNLTSLIDLAPTLLEAVGLEALPNISGQSLWPLLSGRTGPEKQPGRSHILLGKERHNHARADNLGYPERAIRTDRYLYIHNLKPDRWPMGDPPHFRCHTKMKNPTKEFILSQQTEAAITPLFHLTYGKRPAREFYDLHTDPHCLENRIHHPDHQETIRELAETMTNELREQGDPRMHAHGDIFDSYPFFGRIQPDLPGFKAWGQYNSDYWPYPGTLIPRLPKLR